MIEVEHCQGLAAKCDAEKPNAPKICAGIMGWADFQDPRVEELLAADCRVRNFRGIRGPQPVSFNRHSGEASTPASGTGSCFCLYHFPYPEVGSLYGRVAGCHGPEVLPRHGADGKVRFGL
jgi:hypothetical protein